MDLIGIAAFFLAGLTPLTDPHATKPDLGPPQVQPLRTEFHYRRPPAGQDVAFSTYLTDARGNKVYKFECHDGAYDDDSEIRFSDDLQCALFAYKGDTVSAFNLLALDTRSESLNDWWNRGRLVAAQLQGDCLEFPEYSTVRHFHLRGMVVTLEYRDISWDKAGALVGFTLVFDVAPDPEAKNLTVSPPEGPTPPSACYPGPKPKAFPGP